MGAQDALLRHLKHNNSKLWHNLSSRKSEEVLFAGFFFISRCRFKRGFVTSPTNICRSGYFWNVRGCGYYNSGSIQDFSEFRDLNNNRFKLKLLQWPGIWKFRVHFWQKLIWASSSLWNVKPQKRGGESSWWQFSLRFFFLHYHHLNVFFKLFLLHLRQFSASIQCAFEHYINSRQQWILHELHAFNVGFVPFLQI